MRNLFVLIFIFVLIAGCENSGKNTEQPASTQLTNNEIESKISTLLSQMSLKDKASQMLNIGLPSILTGGYWDARDSVVYDTERFQKLIVDYNVGSIHNTPGFTPNAEQWTNIIQTIQEASMNDSKHGIPVLYGIDNIHGANYVLGSVMFPHQIAMAATWNRELSKISGEIASYESRAASLPWNFNPNIDLAPNPLWGRIGESYGEDSYLISEMANAYIEGSQQKGLDHPESTAVCLKHYIGYGAGRNGKDRANAIIPENMLRQYYLPPFKKAIENGAMGVMISSNAVNGIPCHINAYYINEILKGEMKFNGVVISDFSDVEFLVGAHQSAHDLKEATKLAVNAGLDLLMNPYDAKVVDHIVELVNEGEISNERIDDATRRVLRLKFNLNLFNRPFNKAEDFDKVGSEEHIAANYKAASEAITLLKNKNSLLPLSKNQRILVTGYAANSLNVLNGAWSRTFLGRDTLYNDNTKKTILEAIKSHIGAANIEFEQATDYETDINNDLAIKKAAKVDCIVVCVGEIPATEKPSDINELMLPEAQQNLIKKLAKTGKPIVLVMVQGRPRIIREVEPMTNAIIMAYLPGQEGGRAVADVLFGKVNPSGKLPYTYPKFSGNALTYNYKKTDIRDINWGFDGFYPQYEFGYGLSYSNFEYGKFQISHDTIRGNELIEISIDVTNTGDKEGKEIVQLYIKDKVAVVSPDTKKLINFEKITLDSGKSRTVKFELNKEDLKSIGIDDTWTVEDGLFEIMVGGLPQELLSKEIYYKN